MNLAIIDYKAGNVQSVLFALERMGLTATVTSDPEVIRKADKVIFPGVGEASSAMHHLKFFGLDELIPTLEQPFLGICLGMQLLCTDSEENNTEALGVIPVSVKRFRQGQKVPHMGWNTLTDLRGPLFKEVPEESYVYFVHSYYVPVNDHTIATTDYEQPFSAAVQYKNFYAVQFHTEKSSTVGAQIFRKFREM
jgi:imidazole glycerol-phosphate synthase subunit HisH